MGVEGRRGGRGGQRNNPTSFSTATSPKAGKTPKTFLNFRFTPFATVLKNFKAVLPSATPSLIPSL